MKEHKVSKTSDISISISSPENSWNEVNQIDIIFGKIILIISNTSYKAGFSNRIEDTEVFKQIKNKDVNPCVLCDDVYNNLGEENLNNIDRILTIISNFNK